MTKVYGQSPYYDDYDPTKNYNTILARAGEIAQSREINQLQTTLYDHLGRVADTILKDGNIVEGCSLIIQGKKAIISSGSIYMNGLVNYVPSSEIAITGDGTEVIGVVAHDELITEANDSSLRDPAQGFDNQGQPGAHRNKTTIEYKLNDPNAAPVYTLIDGVQSVETYNPELEMITDQLARRTYDESGNYKVRGLLVQNRDDQTDSNKIFLTLTNGKAYIKGYEVTKPTNSKFSVRRSMEFTTALNEQKRYTNGVLTYKLNNRAVKEIKRVTMDVYEEKKVTRGPIPAGRDTLTEQNQSVVSILEVFDANRTYSYSDDYYLDDNNTTINWGVPTGNEPSSGSTYTVRMVVTQDVDEKLFKMGKESDELLDYLVLDAKAPKPYIKSNTQFTGIFKVEYDFYYARRDLVLLNKLGEISVIEGNPDVSSRVETPLNQDDNLLVLASVNVLPNAASIDILNTAEDRLTMENLYRLVSRINDLEWNQAISDLDRAAQEGEDATRLNGVYTDGFINIEKCDASHPEFNAAVDLDMGELTVTSDTTVLPINVGNSPDTNVGIIGKVITAPFDHKLELSQPVTTGTMLVNKYAVYNPLSLITLTPSVDNWIDEEKTTINKTQTKSIKLRKWWRHRGAEWAEAERKKWLSYGYSDGGKGAVNYYGTDTTTATNKESQTSYLDEAIMYMRTKDIKVEGTNFLANANNIKCTFDDRVIPITPMGTTTAGSTSGTVRANSEGKFSGKITVPANSRCGTVEVKFENDNNSGSAVYTAEGRKRTITETVLTTITHIKSVDPIAQSFSFDRDTILTRAGLYFATKDNDKSIIVEIRNMVNGYPGNVAYAQVEVEPQDIKVSDKGKEETVVQFNQPVYCDQDVQYCVCVLSDSNKYEMFIAELGENNLETNKPQLVQPYPNGVLFSSSNAFTWTAHQTMDLKFNLYKAVYNPSGGKINFGEVGSDVINRILLASDYLDKKNAGITWSFSVDNGNTWSDLETYVDRDLLTTTKKVMLIANINVINNSSPMITGDAINLVTFLDGDQFTYVSRNVGVDTPYTKVKVTIDSNYQVDPAISSQRIYIASDINGRSWRELTNPTVTQASGEMNRFEYNVSGLSTSGLSNYRVKVYMKTNNILSRPRATRLLSVMKY